MYRHFGPLRFFLLLGIWVILFIACISTAVQVTQVPPTITVQALIATDTHITTSTNLPAIEVVETSAPTSTVTPLPIPSPTPATVRFAVIGDYGEGNQAEADVSSLVKSWNPDLIITTGDNNYPSGSAATIDDHIGRYYHEFIQPYTGVFGEEADQNRFFPTLGNHDWDTHGAQPYLDYFNLPGNERYYDFVWPPVHFLALDSDSREPDGVGAGSFQATWLQEKLASSSSIWKIVYMHHPPYSSGIHGPVDWMVWPFREWGATAVLAGHDHVYERLLVDGLVYFNNGLGGGPIYSFVNIDPRSQARYNTDYGAMLVDASEQMITFQFVNRKGEIIDMYELSR